MNNCLPSLQASLTLTEMVSLLAKEMAEWSVCDFTSDTKIIRLFVLTPCPLYFTFIYHNVLPCLSWIPETLESCLRFFFQFVLLIFLLSFSHHSIVLLYTVQHSSYHFTFTVRTICHQSKLLYYLWGYLPPPPPTHPIETGTVIRAMCRWKLPLQSKHKHTHT